MWTEGDPVAGTETSGRPQVATASLTINANTLTAIGLGGGPTFVFYDIAGGLDVLLHPAMPPREGERLVLRAQDGQLHDPLHSGLPGLVDDRALDVDGVGQQEERLDVKDEEDDGVEIILGFETDQRVTLGFEAALVGRVLVGTGLAGREFLRPQRGQSERRQREPGPGEDEHDQEQVGSRLGHDGDGG